MVENPDDRFSRIKSHKIMFIVHQPHCCHAMHSILLPNLYPGYALILYFARKDKKRALCQFGGKYSYTNRHAIVCVGTILKELTCLLRRREFCCFCPVQAHYVNVCFYCSGSWTCTFSQDQLIQAQKPGCMPVFNTTVEGYGFKMSLKMIFTSQLWYLSVSV